MNTQIEKKMISSTKITTIFNNQNTFFKQKTISNPSDGKYELKETATTDGATTNTVFTYENNIIKSIDISTTKGSDTSTMSYTYKYGNVSISFDKTDYTLLTNS